MSKFDKIFEARETDTLKTEKSRGNKPAPNKVKVLNIKTPENIPSPEADNPGETLETTGRDLISVSARRGRPAAKRSNPDFVGLTTYVRRDTHLRAKIALLQEGEGKELSELVEELIHEWLEKK